MYFVRKRRYYVIIFLDLCALYFSIISFNIPYGKMHVSSLFSAASLYFVSFNNLTDWFVTSNFQECSNAQSLMYEFSSLNFKIIKLFSYEWSMQLLSRYFQDQRNYFASLLKKTWKSFSTQDDVSLTAKWKKEGIQESCKDFTLLRIKYAQYTGYYVDKF